MDLTFHCSKCKQELVVDASGAGSEINCPSCNAVITVPSPDPTNVHTSNPIMTSAAAREEKHYSVPVHEGPTEALIQKGPPRLEVAAKATDKIMRIKTIRRTDCMEVGHDKFDDVVTKFLQNLAPEEVISISTIAYTHTDLATRALLTDYGVLIVYRG